MLAGNKVQIPTTTLALTPNAVNYVYVDLQALVVTVNTTGWPASSFPLATVQAGAPGTDNYGVVDCRPHFCISVG
jgi:hypothetical protein